MKKIKCLVLLLFAGITIFGLTGGSDLVRTVGANSSGPPLGFSSAPDESSCTACHGSATGGGQFTINAPAKYIPGQTYQIQVRHTTSDATRRRWGFQLSPRAATGTATGAFANLNANTSTDSANGFIYVQHTLAGTFTNQTGGAIWNFNWTAPATNAGAITFYAAGNQADNAGGPTGDQIYETNAVVRFGRSQFDFDGDGRSDVSVFRPSNGFWYALNSTNGFSAAQFGAANDRIVPADYDGDGKTDLAVYRNGNWFLQRSSLGFIGANFSAFGLSTADPSDIPLAADVDGDGRAELVIFRAVNGIWYSYSFTNGSRAGVQFGATGDKPVIADYDGDGRADLAVFRPSNGTWYLNRSQLGFIGIQFGASEDRPVAADYDGDNRTDVAVFRPSNGTWYINRSQLGFTGVQFGASGDLPVPADYDGDNRTDVAVFRPSNGTWYLNRSQSGLTGVSFGASDDRPAPNAFVP